LIYNIIDNYIIKSIKVLKSINNINIYNNNIIEDNESFNDIINEYYSCDIIYTTDEYNTIFIIND
jgi:hypothetical protein